MNTDEGDKHADGMTSIPMGEGTDGMTSTSTSKDEHQLGLAMGRVRGKFLYA